MGKRNWCSTYLLYAQSISWIFIYIIWNIYLITGINTILPYCPSLFPHKMIHTHTEIHINLHQSFGWFLEQVHNLHCILNQTQLFWWWREACGEGLERRLLLSCQTLHCRFPPTPLKAACHVLDASPRLPASDFSETEQNEGKWSMLRIINPFLSIVMRLSSHWYT